MEPNVNEFCLVCKESGLPVMQTKTKEFLCQSCAEAYDYKFVAYKKKAPEKKTQEADKLTPSA